MNLCVELALACHSFILDEPKQNATTSRSLEATNQSLTKGKRLMNEMKRTKQRYGTEGFGVTTKRLSACCELLSGPFAGARF